MVVPMTPTIGQPLAITTCPSTKSPAQKPQSSFGRSTSSERKDRAPLWGARSARADIIDVGLVTGVGRSPPENSSYPAVMQREDRKTAFRFRLSYPAERLFRRDRAAHPRRSPPFR